MMPIWHRIAINATDLEGHSEHVGSILYINIGKMASSVQIQSSDIQHTGPIWDLKSVQSAGLEATLKFSHHIYTQQTVQ